MGRDKTALKYATLSRPASVPDERNPWDRTSQELAEWQRIWLADIDTYADRQHR